MQPKLKFSLQRINCIVAAALIALLTASPQLRAGTVYTQSNLVSNNTTTTPASYQDPNLINPWGNVSNGGSPFWVSDQGSGNSTLYDTSTSPPGGIVPLVVAIPGGNPTGIVANTSGFNVNGSPAAFIFDTLGGTIAGWNGTPLNTAVTEVTVGGAVYTGLAEASTSTGTFLYAADFRKNKGIDVFDSTYKLQKSSLFPFEDPNLPKGYAPYNIQAINNSLYVEYDPIGNNGLPVPGLGNGIVDVFDSSGKFLQRLITGGQLDDPWGIALAPAGFGQFGGDLLVGNFDNGWINAFNPTTGAFIGTLDVNGKPFAEPALWSLVFGIGMSGGSPNVLYFTSGLTLAQTGGLLGSISTSSPTPEPATLTLLGSGLLGLLGLGRRKRG